MCELQVKRGTTQQWSWYGYGATVSSDMLCILSGCCSILVIGVRKRCDSGAGGMFPKERVCRGLVSFLRFLRERRFRGECDPNKQIAALIYSRGTT